MTRYHRMTCLLSLTALLVCADRASADTFMLAAGIGGDVAEGPYKGWLRVESVDAAITAGSSWSPSSGATIGKPKPMPIKVAFPAGPWSVAFMRAIEMGRSVSQVVIDHIGADGRPAYRFRLDNVLLTSQRTSSASMTPTMSEIELVYKRIRYEVFTTSADGRTLSTPLEWDVMTMQVAPAN
ncbi:MAG: type VI secretion system tube protein Hcp [Steroidobacteraceae bacterium]